MSITFFENCVFFYSIHFIHIKLWNNILNIRNIFGKNNKFIIFELIFLILYNIFLILKCLEI